MDDEYRPNSDFLGDEFGSPQSSLSVLSEVTVNSPAVKNSLAPPKKKRFHKNDEEDALMSLVGKNFDAIKSMSTEKYD